MAKYFEKMHIHDLAKIIILLSLSFMLVTIEDYLITSITFSALIAIMFIGIALQKYRQIVAERLAVRFSKLWVSAEILLIVLVGTTVDIRYVWRAGVAAFLLILRVLLFRMAGVFCCLLATKLCMEEHLFCMIAYTPKATVQPAIGGIPLAIRLSCGNIVLTVAVLSIFITAPLGAFLIDLIYKKLLMQSKIAFFFPFSSW